MTEPLTETERFSWLTADSRRLLDWLHEHPHAPRYNHHCGDRLTADGLERVRHFEQELNAAPPAWTLGQKPAWVPAFAAECFRDVPFYRRRGAPPADFADFADFPTCSRADLSREPWSFVPDSLPLDDLLVYQTSGTTGHPLSILSHPVVASSYLPLMRAALERHGVKLEGGPSRVSILLVCFQQRTFTYASVSSYLDGAGFAKINLNPADWRDPADRARFIDDCQPEIFTGDPLSFAELGRLPIRHKPRALISTAMQLLPGLRGDLEERFGCPVIDLYAMNEAGPIAAGTSQGYALLQPRLYVEILDEAGQPCAAGVRGEVTLTGGFNPFIPLLRYRTGDTASLQYYGSQPMLRDLEGRPPIVFQGAAGRQINNIDVTGVLKPFALPRYQLHQAASGAVTLRLPPGFDNREAVRAALLGLFGAQQALEIVEVEPLSSPNMKLIQYTREAA
jgi:phenylacetate-CoA ligase